MAVTEQLERLERLAERMYRETFERLEDPLWSKDVGKVTLLYLDDCYPFGKALRKNFCKAGVPSCLAEVKRAVNADRERAG